MDPTRTIAGGTYILDAVQAVAPVPDLMLTWPGDFPYNGSLAGNTSNQVVKVSGMNPNSSHTVSLTALSDDFHLRVYSDSYLTLQLCASENGGTLDELCSVSANVLGSLYLLIDSSATAAGGTYTLNVQ